MPNDHEIRRQITIAAFLVLATSTVARAQDAAALVRQVRDREAWIDRVESFHLKAEGRWEKTPQGIEHHRRELAKQFPGADLSASPDLQPRKSETVELAFDRNRIRLRVDTHGEYEDLRIWDGTRFILHNRSEKAPDHNGYLINRDPKNWLYWLVWTNIFSFRAGPHLFWWNDSETRKEIVRMAGKPEDFVYGGEAVFRATRCRVVNHWDSWTSLYISVKDGRLQGIRSGALTTPRLHLWFLDELRNRGYPFRDVKEWDRQRASVKPEDMKAISREGAKRMTKVVDPVFEYWLSDDQEVAPGCVLPMTQGAIHHEVDDDGKPFISARHTLTITEAKVNQPLPDTLFAVEFNEGEWINDQTHEPPLRYRHKANMKPEEWETIIAEGRKKAKRERDHEQKQAALIGRPAVPFPAEAAWLNGKPLDWFKLKGKVVVLAFWAEWCGPCRNDLPALSALHKKLPDNMVVIGIHPPGSKAEAIEKAMKTFDIAYPICIDTPAPQGAAAWGTLFKAYEVDRIPQALVIDPQGKIAATGELSDVLTRASELAGKPH